MIRSLGSVPIAENMSAYRGTESVTSFVMGTPRCCFHISIIIEICSMSIGLKAGAPSSALATSVTLSSLSSEPVFPWRGDTSASRL
jgi:hypothetical protein